MFCKRCRYNLKAIESRTCPECGRAFDPQNLKTYRKRVGLPKWVRRIGQGLVVLFAVALIALGVIEWRYQREAGAANVMEQLNGRVQWSDDAHQWAEWFPFLHERLQHVARLRLVHNQLTTLPPELWNLTKLEWVIFTNNQLTTLAPEIGKFANLKGLDLTSNQLTKLPPEIGKLTKLKVLYLDGNPITDGDLNCLNSMKDLRHLRLSGSKVTREGVAAFRLALPNCYIDDDFLELNP